MLTKQKISITLDSGLVTFLNKERGDVPLSKFIENYVRAKVHLHEALWIFKDEMDKITATEWLSAHTTQPIGKPLHKHKGFIAVDKGNLIFYDEEMDRQFSVRQRDIRGLSVSYDATFRRFRDSRGLIPPLHFRFNNKGIYLFTRPANKVMYTGYDKAFLGELGIAPEKAGLSLTI